MKLKWKVVLFVVLALAGMSGLLLWQHDVAFEEASRLCRLSERALTLREQAQLLDRATPYQQRIAIFGDSAYACRRAESDLRQMLDWRIQRRWTPGLTDVGLDLATRSLGGEPLPERPNCVQFPVHELPCSCGTQRFPEDWKDNGLPQCLNGQLRVAPAQ